MIGQRILQLTKNTAVYGLGSAFIGIIGVILIPLMTRSISPTEYGLLDLLITVVALTSAIVGMGFDSALGILFFKKNEDTNQNAVISTALWTVTIAASALALLGSGLSPYLTRILLGPDHGTTAVLLTLWIIPVSLLQGFLLTVLRIRFQSLAYIYSIATYVLVMIFLTMYLVLYQKLGIVGYLWGWLGAGICTSIVAWGSVREIAFQGIHRIALRHLIRIGWPLIPAGLAGWSLSLIDRFFVKYYTFTDLGYYALAVKISSILGLVTAALQLAWGPFALSISREPEAKQTYSRVATLYFAVTGIVALALTTMAQRIIILLSGPTYIPAVYAIPPLLLGAIAYGSYYIFSVGASIAEKTKYISWTTVIAAMCNIGLNFIFIPLWGIIGAAIATAISYCLSAILMAISSQRVFPIPYQRWSCIMLYLSTALGCIIISQSTQPVLVGSIVTLLFGIGLLVTNTISPIAVQQLFRKQLPETK